MAGKPGQQARRERLGDVRHGAVKREVVGDDEQTGKALEHVDQRRA